MAAPTRRRRASSESNLLARRALLSFGAACFALGAAGCGAHGGAAAPHAVADHPLLGSAAPPLDVHPIGGASELRLDAHRGQVVLVDFWATWCEPCRQSFRAYQKLAEEFRDKLVVLAISVDESADAIPAFVKQTGAKFPIGWDEGQAAAQSYQPPKMPTCFIVDESGIVRFVHAGFSPGDEAELRGEIQSLL